MSKSKIEILFEISWKEFESYFKKASLILGENVTVKGFRPGKMPQEALEEQIGTEKILQKAANLAIEEKYSQVIREKKIEVASQPQRAVFSGENFDESINLSSNCCHWYCRIFWLLQL
ncbi:unnamed protein product, partial [marine sediment metagenome]